MPLALHSAARGGAAEITEWLLAAGADPKRANHAAQTAEHVALSLANRKIAHLLASHVTPTARPLALHSAARGGAAEITEWLLAAGADPKRANHAAQTAEHVALSLANRKIAHLLASHVTPTARRDDAAAKKKAADARLQQRIAALCPSAAAAAAAPAPARVHFRGDEEEEEPAELTETAWDRLHRGLPTSNTNPAAAKYGS
ncbi:hypothetical protein DIPPA_10825 [Diplonema papillatum]|nr:hypothetical protein DIPPA_10825 [Diplonema papillatum]